MHGVGKGGQGEVFIEVYKGARVAVKRLDKQATEKDVKREYEICKKIQHPNVVKYIGKPELEGGHWVIRMELINGEDLSTTIFQRNKSKIQLTDAMKTSVLQGMCQGLLVLHNNNIVHQDLKPNNIMIEYGTLRPVIIDFGLANIFRASRGLYSGLKGGTPQYEAPEARTGRAEPDVRSDVWATGKIMAELLLELPAPVNPDKMSPAWIQRKLQGSPYCSVISSMLDERPEHRPSMGAVVNAVKRARAPQISAAHQAQAVVVRPRSVAQQALACQNAALGKVAKDFPLGVLHTGTMRRTVFKMGSDGKGTFEDVKAETQNNKVTSYDRTSYEW